MLNLSAQLKLLYVFVLRCSTSLSVLTFDHCSSLPWCLIFAQDVETWKRGFIYYDEARERGERSLLGMGRGVGGRKRTYRKRYLISDLIRCCQATNDEKPDLKSFPCISYLFPIATSEKNSWSIFEVNVSCFSLKILRYRTPFKSPRDGKAITTS